MSRAQADVAALELIAQLSMVLEGESANLCCAYLFGSSARGDERPGSDVDVAVLFREAPPRTLAGLHLDLAERLTGALGGRRVDLVLLNHAPVDLVHRVLRDGVLLLERDRSARIRFEVNARNEYFDLLPHLQRYRRGQDEVRR